MKQINVKKCIEELGYVIVPIQGTSMWPLLVQGKSQVQLIQKNIDEIKVGDVILYQNDEGSLILHRLMKRVDDDLWMLGDHQWKLNEKICCKQILAVAQGFFRNGSYVDEKTWWYRFYKFLWMKNLTVRRCCLAFLRLSGIEKKSLK